MPFGDMIINQTQQLKIMKQKTGHRKQSWYYLPKTFLLIMPQIKISKKVTTETKGGKMTVLCVFIVTHLWLQTILVIKNAGVLNYYFAKVLTSYVQIAFSKFFVEIIICKRIICIVVGSQLFK